MIQYLLRHHVLTSVTFWLVIAIGTYAYLTLPREQDPSINFNWVQIVTGWPGASAADIERRITTPLEEGLAKVSDIKFLSSTSREGFSSILVRFTELGSDQFNRRISDLRREVQVIEAELPDEISGPNFLEITSANAFPTASLVIVGHTNDHNLRRFARNAEEDLERWAEIERVDSFGDAEPEILVHFSLERLSGLGINPAQVADTVTSYFRDLAAGTISLGELKWLIRLAGTSNDPELIGRLPVASSGGEVPLRSIADITLGTEDAEQLVQYQGRPAILMSVFKQDNANNLELLTKLNAYLETRNQTNAALGIEMVLIDDQTVATKEALTVMQNNAIIGLILVFLVTWGFLGARIAFFTTVGIPFVLAGTLFILYLLGQTHDRTMTTQPYLTLHKAALPDSS